MLMMIELKMQQPGLMLLMGTNLLTSSHPPEATKPASGTAWLDDDDSEMMTTMTMRKMIPPSE